MLVVERSHRVRVDNTHGPSLLRVSRRCHPQYLPAATVVLQMPAVFQGAAEVDVEPVVTLDTLSSPMKTTIDVPVGRVPITKAWIVSRVAISTAVPVMKWEISAALQSKPFSAITRDEGTCATAFTGSAKPTDGTCASSRYDHDFATPLTWLALTTTTRGGVLDGSQAPSVVVVSPAGVSGACAEVVVVAIVVLMVGDPLFAVVGSSLMRSRASCARRITVSGPGLASVMLMRT